MMIKSKTIVVIAALFGVLGVIVSILYINMGTVVKVEPHSQPISINLDIKTSLPPPSSYPNHSLPSNVDRLLNQMEFGNIAFNTPNNININDSPLIELALSLSETIEKLKRSITEEGEKEGATVRVSDRMEARLSGNMFQITAITPEIQAVSKNRRTKWKWEIHPKEEGMHKLHLTLTALLEIDGHSTPRVIRTFDKIISINVSATQKASLFFKGNWQWLWTVILVPIAGWFWKRRKNSW